MLIFLKNKTSEKKTEQNHCIQTEEIKEEIKC